MPGAAPVSAAIRARIVHGAMVAGIVTFGLVAWLQNRVPRTPVYALPDRRVLYIALFLVSAILFGAAMFTAGRLGRAASGTSQDEWWRVNLGKAVVTWALVEVACLLGLVAYMLTGDFRVLLATLTGLLLFGTYRPSRLTER